MPEKPPKIKPLIKWTGGKYDEFPLFEACIPPFQDYYEPFFGGGGVFFALQPQGRSFVNDRSADLMAFYNQINTPAFEQQLHTYVQAWAQTDRLALWFCKKYLSLFTQFIQSDATRQSSLAQAHAWVNKLAPSTYTPLFEAAFCIGPQAFKNQLAESVGDKMVRIRRICRQEGRIFDSHELTQHLTTAIKSAFYMHLRYLLNLALDDANLMVAAKAAANWYFVRELCYGSMFRYNSSGQFNIPYGGIAYNTKNMGQKVASITSPQLKELISRTRFFNADFQDFLEQQAPRPQDFIFLDPPYDTEFSSYDNHAFTQQDQQRLATCLQAQQAQWMLVIKETPFIKKLYKEIGACIRSFDKQYTYNVRGRNNRAVRHLIISNYDTRALRHR